MTHGEGRDVYPQMVCLGVVLMVLFIASELGDHKLSQVKWTKLGVASQGSDPRRLGCSQLLVRCEL